MKLGGFDLILVIDYLRTLGPILWDLDHLCMAFDRVGLCVFWP